MTRYLALLLLVLCVASLLAGGAGLGVPPSTILWLLRLPRTVLAVAVGAGLGVSGAVLQGALGNRLADPGLLGIGGCASLGGAVAFYWGLAAAAPLALPLAGFLGAALGGLALFGFAARAGTGLAFILAGVALASVASALLALAMALAPNPFALAELGDWLMGSVADKTPATVLLASVPIAVGCAMLLRLGTRLDALALGETTAASLGFDAAATWRWAAAGVALAVGAGAATAGGIGFVGLIVPNLLRPAVGERPAALLWPSLLGGACLLLAADLLARLAPMLLPLHAQPRLGVLTALLGAPFLVILARR
ncbi:MAG: iron chelate uptake ABC transporter family permease subunit [Rhodospirillales bacterium]|nr:iron chelate uptake ABC transporter family permease subunit [Rhodospirillales bacterium]